MSRKRKALAILMRARMRAAVSSANTAAYAKAGAQTSGAALSSDPPLPLTPLTESEVDGCCNPLRAAAVVKDVKALMHASITSSDRSADNTETTIEDFLEGYSDLSTEGRRELLLSLAHDYDVDRSRVRFLLQQYLSLSVTCSGDLEDQSQSDSHEDGSVMSSFYRIERNLRAALKPKYAIFFDHLNAHPGGLKLLVNLRADILSVLKQKNIASLRALDSFLKEKLITWLSPATLELRQITWDDSASLLEKIVAYEAVHPIRNLLDLKRRLSSGRRCFGYLHPAIPGEPLIFIEVALVKKIAQSIQEVLWDSPPIPEHEAVCALFYSISSTQAGLAGINLGKFLIKRVIELLKREMPHVLTFATLSPIPGYMQWLQSKLSHYINLTDSVSESMQEDRSSSTFRENILRPEEERAIIDACLGDTIGRSGMEVMLKLLMSPRNWVENDQLLAALKRPLMRLCARYLLKEKKRGKALDVVANFHLQNGAMIERINWMADRSEKGFCQSAGIMVNYVYRLDQIEENALSYFRTGNVQASHELRLYIEPEIMLSEPQCGD